MPIRPYAAAAASGAASAVLYSAAAPLAGRNARRQWMHEASIVLRDRGVMVRPGAPIIATGVALRIAREATWAIVFERALLRPFPRARRGLVLVAAAVPWAVGTAAFERWLVLSWLRPERNARGTFVGDVLVRSAAVLLYPTTLEPGRDDPVAALRDSRIRLAGGLTAAAVFVRLVAGDVLARAGHAPRMAADPGRSEAESRFLRALVRHEVVGVELARLAAERGELAAVQTLGRTLWGDAIDRIACATRWRQNWYPDLDPSTEAEAQVLGLTPWSEVERLEATPGHPFQTALLGVWLHHHAVLHQIADRLLQEGADPRLRLLARQVRRDAERNRTRLERLLHVARPVEEEGVAVRVTERLAAAPPTAGGAPTLAGRLLDAARRVPVLGAAPAAGAAPLPPPTPRRRPPRSASFARKVDNIARTTVLMGRLLDATRRGPGNAGRTGPKRRPGTDKA